MKSQMFAMKDVYTAIFRISIKYIICLTKRFLKPFKEAYKMGVVSFGISGGEPMAHPSFKDFIKYAKKFDMTITILTNLTPA